MSPLVFEVVGAAVAFALVLGTVLFFAVRDPDVRTHASG